jgi:hypothetical protein
MDSRSQGTSPVVPSGLVVFLSVDLAGSTAFKVAAKALPDAATPEASFQKWLPVFTGFYFQFPERLKAAFELERQQDARSDLGEAPSFWKPIGDELVFTKRLTEHAQAFRTVRAFREAVLRYRKELSKKHPSLDLKASAWLAGFPIGNTQVPMGETSGMEKLDLDGEPILVAYNLAKATSRAKPTQTRVDYLGPAIDAGFRIGKLASPRRFVISIDLALLITETNHPRALDFRYDGRVELKGVLGNTPYPIFWIDMGPSALEKLEDELNHAKPVPATTVHEMAGLFLDSTDGRICRPYIVRDNGTLAHGVIPPEHQELLRRLAEEANKEVERENKALEDPQGAQEIAPVDLDEYLNRMPSSRSAPARTRSKKKPTRPRRTKG